MGVQVALCVLFQRGSVGRSHQRIEIGVLFCGLSVSKPSGCSLSFLALPTLEATAENHDPSAAIAKRAKRRVSREMSARATAEILISPACICICLICIVGRTVWVVWRVSWGIM